MVAQKQPPTDGDKITGGLVEVAVALHKLGNSDVATPMGAIEALSKEVKEGFQALSAAVLDLADAIRSR